MSTFMRKITFIKPNIKSLEDGTKTETRREHGLKIVNAANFEIAKTERVNNKLHVTFYSAREAIIIASHYKFDELLYVGEPVMVLSKGEKTTPLTPFIYLFENGYPESKAAVKKLQEKGYTFRSPLFLEKFFARYYVKIKDIKCEKVQDVSKESIIKEGIDVKNFDLDTSRIFFATLYNKVNGPASYDKNPFVFVYTFTITNRNGEGVR